MRRWKVPLVQALVLVAVVLIAGPWIPSPWRVAAPPVTPPSPLPPEPVPNVEPAGPVRMELLPSQTALLAGQPSELFLAVRLTTQDAGTSERLPLNLAVVLDKSGSMSNANKIDYARKAARLLVDKLSPRDTFSLVVYDSEVEVLVPASPLGDAARVRAIIDRIEPAGSTNLSGGLQRGAEEVAKNLKPGQINRVLLMTDGLANNGETDPARLAQMAAGYLRRGISISTFGLGAEFNEDVLQTMAESASGQYHFIESPDQMARIYESEMKDIAKTVVRDAVLTLTPAAGVEVREVLGYSTIRENGKLSVSLGDLYGGRTRKIVVKLAVAAGHGASCEVAAAALAYRDVKENRPGKTTAALQVALFADAERVHGTRDRKVLELTESAQAGATLDSAMRLLQKGQREQARSMLAGQIRATRERNDKDIRSDALTSQVAEYEGKLQQLERSLSSEETSLMVKQNKVLGLSATR